MEFKYNLMDFLIENDMIDEISEKELERIQSEIEFGETPSYVVVEVKGYNDKILYMVFQNTGASPFNDGDDLTQIDIEDDLDYETIMNTYFPESPFSPLVGVFRLTR